MTYPGPHSWLAAEQGMELSSCKALAFSSGPKNGAMVKNTCWKRVVVCLGAIFSLNFPDCVFF